MAILFYDHLINKDQVWMYIEKLDGPDSNKGRLRKLADEIIHQGVLELILQKLHPHQHERFLKLVTNAPYDPLVLEFLRTHADEKIELEIENHGQTLIKEILHDLGLKK
jgi:hypothetical protein